MPKRKSVRSRAAAPLLCGAPHTRVRNHTVCNPTWPHDRIALNITYPHNITTLQSVAALGANLLLVLWLEPLRSRTQIVRAQGCHSVRRPSSAVCWCLYLLRALCQMRARARRYFRTLCLTEGVVLMTLKKPTNKLPKNGTSKSKVNTTRAR